MKRHSFLPERLVAFLLIPFSLMLNASVNKDIDDEHCDCAGYETQNELYHFAPQAVWMYFSGLAEESWSIL